MGIEPTTSGLDLPLLCRLSYEVGQRKSETTQVVNRVEEKVRSCSEVVGSVPTGVKGFFLYLLWSPIPLTRANAQWVIHGFN